MYYCLQCNDRFCHSRTLNLPQREDQVVYLACDSELMSRPYFRRLAVAMVALKLPRREVPDWMCGAIYTFTGEIRWRNGEVYWIGDGAIDTAFNNDGSFRWISEFLKHVENPARQRPQLRILDRLRLIDLAFRIEYPDIALPSSTGGGTANKGPEKPNQEFTCPHCRQIAWAEASAQMICGRAACQGSPMQGNPLRTLPTSELEYQDRTFECESSNVAL